MPIATTTSARLVRRNEPDQTRRQVRCRKGKMRKIDPIVVDVSAIERWTMTAAGHSDPARSVDRARSDDDKEYELQASSKPD